MKNAIIGVAALILLAFGIFMFMKSDFVDPDQTSDTVETINISTFGAYEYYENDNWLIIRDHSTFEGERFGGMLTIFDKKQNKVRTQLSNITSFAYITEEGVTGNKSSYKDGLGLENKILISKYFDLHPSDGPEMYEEGFQPDKNKLKLAESEIGVTLESDRVHAYGGRPIAGVNAIFILDLDTLNEESLKVLGGYSGINNTKDGIVFDEREGNRWYNPLTKTFSRPSTNSYVELNPKVSDELKSGDGWKIVKGDDFEFNLVY